MRKFLSKILLFISILALIFIVGIFIPSTPRASKSLLFSKINKDSLLKNVKSPRIIFIGGSNLSFGLNSRMIKDLLGLNPINTGVHASIGLIYMMDNTLPYIKLGDIVVVAPEYSHFYGTYAYGREELLRTVMDISPSKLSRLRKEQWANIIEFFPKYSFSKLKPTEYFNVKESDIYGVNSYNEYGDVYTHWKLKKRKFQPSDSISEEFNYTVLNELCNFERKLIEKGAIMFVTFPGFQSASFENNTTQIMRVEAELRKKDLLLLGTPERYKMPDSLMFNTSYHLSKKGVDYRTQLLIDDIKYQVHTKAGNVQPGA